MGAEDTYAEDVFEADRARREIAALAAKVWRHCDARGVVGRTVTLKAKYADFRQITRSQTLDAAITTAHDLEAVALVLLDPLFPTGRGVRLLGVTLSALEKRAEFDAGKGQLTLWQIELMT